ncbi:MAG: hypothetical protein ACR2Q4_00295, partial [Geminicoccaceae bacterium]
MVRSCRPVAFSALSALALLSCQSVVEPVETLDVPATATAEAVDATAKPPNSGGVHLAADNRSADIGWSAAPDCLGMLGLLQQALADGRLDSLDGTPFVLITATGHPPVAGSPSIRRRIERRLAPGPAESLADAPAELESRCLLRSGEARDHQGRHRVLGREQVRSEYESGSRREPNPAYDAAKARLKQAERDAKPQK